MGRFILLAFSLSMISMSAQATLIYTFSGVISNGATISHTEVSVGESWTAVVSVDETAAFPTIAVGEIVITFSGGFSNTLAGPGQAIVWNDRAFSTQTLDYVGARITGVENIQMYAFTDVLSTLTSTALPSAGFILDPSPSSTLSGLIQLQYNDALGSIQYLASEVNNVSLAVTAVGVSEPLTVALLGLGLAALGFAQRRKTS